MENAFKCALRKVVDFLDKEGLQYALIGGIANQIWGQARFTYDIDFKILVPSLDYELVRTVLTRAFPNPGRPDLVLPPLILSVNVDGIIVDFLLATPGFEEQLIQNAIKHTIDDLSLSICTADDLIIQKAIAGRQKDWQDIEGIVVERLTKLNQNYIEKWLREFSEILEKPGLWSNYQQIWRRVIAFE